MQQVRDNSRYRIGESFLRDGAGSLPAVYSSAVPILAGAVAFGLYALTLAPDLTWANRSTDGGELITAAVTLGVAHPPGYPLYVLLGKAASLLPLGTPAYRLNLLSAACMAVAVALLVLTVMRLAPRGRSAVAAASVAFLFGFSPLVWGQAVVAEVYALNAALVALALFLLLTTRRPGLTGFALGLATLGHPTSLLLAPLVLYRTPARSWPRLAAGMAFGLLPALLMPLLAAGNSPVVWGNFSSVTGWLDHASARLYRPNLGRWPGSAHWSGLRADLPAGLALPALVGMGALVVSRFRRPAAAATPLPVQALLISAAFYGLLTVAYDTPDAAVLLIPGVMLVCLAALPRLVLVGPGLLLAPALVVALSFAQGDRSADRSVRQAAVALLGDVPANALVLTPGDRTIFTLWYFHHVEGLRPDIIPVDSNLFAFEWYRSRLARQVPALDVPAADDLPALIDAARGRRPICHAVLQSEAPPAFSLTCTD